MMLKNMLPLNKCKMVSVLLSFVGSMVNTCCMQYMPIVSINAITQSPINR